MALVHRESTSQVNPPRETKTKCSGVVSPQRALQYVESRTLWSQDCGACIGTEGTSHPAPAIELPPLRVKPCLGPEIISFDTTAVLIRR